MSGRKKIVVIGGTGYLGQHLLQYLSEIDHNNILYDLAFTHHSNPPQALLSAFPHARAFSLDLQSGEGFDAITLSFGKPEVVVNCAALSVPRVCEIDPSTAMSINVPSSLVNWLSSLTEHNALLIHLSTDQVYEGVKSFYKEEDETLPVNVYGKSKICAERFITEKYPNFAILRSSIIVGSQTISPVSKSLPIQWMDSVLSKGEPVEFFHDEFRCPVFVADVVSTILKLANTWMSEAKQMQLVLNVGGPERLSRAEMAEAVADAKRYDISLIKRVSASSVDRGVKSPADISMDISKLVETQSIHPTLFAESVRLTFAAETKS